MSITAIEDALIARIKATLTNKVRTVETLPGDWDDETLKRVLRAVPGVFILFGGGTAKAVGGQAPSIDAQWMVYVCTAHASGEAARRRGDALQAGAYELCEVLIPALHNYAPPNENALQLARVENLFTGSVERQGIAVYALAFQQLVTLPPTLDTALLDEFETFDVQWDVPPHTTAAEHRKWLDGDYATTRPDAQDRVAVPQI